MLHFEKPDYKIVEEIENNFYGKFELEPLERGFGTTIGNALRRVMLSSLPGSAIVCVKIQGAMHEFQTLDGIVEDVTTIVLNLKSIVIKNHSKEDKIIRLNVQKEGIVTAGDIEKDSDIEIINPNQVIATISKGGSLIMEMTVNNGRGYVRSEENKKEYTSGKHGVIAVDSLYSPIERVSYEVENARVGQNENFDKLIFNVWTNGSMKPEEAIALSSRILIEHLEVVADLNNIANVTGLLHNKPEVEETKKLEITIDDLDLSVRASNCLKKMHIYTIEDLVSKSVNDMMRIRNLGKKSLEEVIKKVEGMGLKLRADSDDNFEEFEDEEKDGGK
ncbi:MAG: DNA-directed RNA polymerase subunit alpha [Bacilli bacterium]